MIFSNDTELTMTSNTCGIEEQMFMYRPFRADLFKIPHSPGVARGWYVRPFQGQKAKLQIRESGPNRRKLSKTMPRS